MIRKLEIERFSLTTFKAFTEVIAGVNAAIGQSGRFPRLSELKKQHV